MRKSTLKITHPDVTQKALAALVTGHGLLRKARRIAVVQGILDGASPSEVSRYHHISRQAVYDIVGRVNARGLAGLDDGNHPGKHGQLTPELRQELTDVLAKPPQACGYRQSRWDGPLLKRYLEERHAIHLCVSQVNRWFHKLGATLQRGRQTFLKADLEAQKEFESRVKKNFRSPAIPK
jgi:transposase